MSEHETAVICRQSANYYYYYHAANFAHAGLQSMARKAEHGRHGGVPCVLLHTNRYALLYYACAIDDMVPLFATSVLGVLVGEILAYCFYRWTDYKCATMKTVIGSFVVSVSVTIYETLALAGRTGQSREQSSQL
ncbi:unnamed protein product [Peronospora destructor]|uniref:Uncharacterized protein n=1 Tax=Peronospora destructor TaxID=86335 RepID=A0AAV0SU52_9STRA|nr:unnamed protein product [Peronospora destructor]